MKERERFPFHGHDEGLVIDGPDTGFKRTPMTPAQLAAREPALAIAKDIFRHANRAGVCYAEIWEIIAKAMQGVMDMAATAPDLTRLREDLQRYENGRLILSNEVDRLRRERNEQEERADQLNREISSLLRVLGLAAYDVRGDLNEVYELIFDIECRRQEDNDRLYQAKKKLIAMRRLLGDKPDVDKQLLKDRRAFGSAYLRIDLDGTWTRLDPERVCVRKPEDVR